MSAESPKTSVEALIAEQKRKVSKIADEVASGKNTPTQLAAELALLHKLQEIPPLPRDESETPKTKQGRNFRPQIEGEPINRYIESFNSLCILKVMERRNAAAPYTQRHIAIEILKPQYKNDEAHIKVAIGRVSEQKAEFKKYLLGHAIDPNTTPMGEIARIMDTQIAQNPNNLKIVQWKGVSSHLKDRFLKMSVQEFIDQILYPAKEKNNFSIRPEVEYTACGLFLRPQVPEYLIKLVGLDAFREASTHSGIPLEIGLPDSNDPSHIREELYEFMGNQRVWLRETYELNTDKKPITVETYTPYIEQLIESCTPETSRTVPIEFRALALVVHIASRISRENLVRLKSILFPRYVGTTNARDPFSNTITLSDISSTPGLGTIAAHEGPTDRVDYSEAVFDPIPSQTKKRKRTR